MSAQDRIEAKRSTAADVIKFADAQRNYDATSADMTHKVSRWNRYLYRQERKENAGLLGSEVEGAIRNTRYPDFQRELFSRIYSPRTRQLDEVDPGYEWAQKLHDCADELPEFRSLQQQCRGDEMWSGMATATLSKSLVAKLPETSMQDDPAELQAKVEALEQLAGRGIDVDAQHLAELKRLNRAEAVAKALADGIDPSAVRNALRKACEEVRKEIDETDDAAEALSFGDQPGAPALLSNTEAKRKLASVIKRNPKLKEIAKLAGRLRRVAAEKQRTKCDRACDEISDVEQGDALHRLLPSELLQAAAGDETLETLFAARLLDRQCLQYKLSGKDTQGRGPIVCCIDVSGSMKGERECWAKAVALALLDVARRQKRTWAVVLFDGKVQKVTAFWKGQVDDDKLIDVLRFFSGGGTNFQKPLTQAMLIVDGDNIGMPYSGPVSTADRTPAPQHRGRRRRTRAPAPSGSSSCPSRRVGKPFAKADILLVTDGCSKTTEEFDMRFSEWKRRSEASLYTVLVNPSYRPGQSIKSLSDQTWFLSELVKDADKFEDAVLSM
jgi:uncharacterized protein with von Willebrand factor type A (vWA) domain